MLSELRIRNLAIIDELGLRFGPGLNVLTGETGAGKSIIIDAVNLLLGDRASQDIVRSGAGRTEVEGVFELTPLAAARIAPLLAEHGLEAEHGDLLVLAREVRSGSWTLDAGSREGDVAEPAAGATGRSPLPDGVRSHVGGRMPPRSDMRSRARVNGRTVTTALLEEIGALLVDVHGQGEHLSLLRPREHIGLLDRYAALDAQAAALGERVRGVGRVRRELAALRQDERELARRVDLLAHQVEEIRSAKLRPGEEEELDGERRRLANAEQLAALSAEATLLLSGGDGEQRGALDEVGAAEQAISRLARLDPDAAPLGERLGELVALLDDVAREVARYRDAIESNPRRLQEVEERVQLIRSLQRKYGDSVEAVLAYGERAAQELAQIEHAGERIAALEAEEASLLAEIGRLGARLSAARRAAGARMARELEAELNDLQLAGARFAVDVAWTPAAASAPVDAGAAAEVGEAAGAYAFDARGLDTVAFLVSANPGEPLKPLARVASGGETSRLMLALKTVLGRADQSSILIFDEIDQGIGGRVGGAVGRKLWGLTAEGGPEAARQVLCITHLPQLAAYGDVHLHVAKHLADGRTVVGVADLSGDARVSELARMLGADSDAGRANAAEIMAEAGRAKQATHADGKGQEHASDS